MREEIVGDGKPLVSGHIAYRAVLKRDEVPKDLWQQADDQVGPRGHVEEVAGVHQDAVVNQQLQRPLLVAAAVAGQVRHAENRGPPALGVEAGAGGPWAERRQQV